MCGTTLCDPTPGGSSLEYTVVAYVVHATGAGEGFLFILVFTDDGVGGQEVAGDGGGVL